MNNSTAGLCTRLRKRRRYPALIIDSYLWHSREYSRPAVYEGAKLRPLMDSQLSIVDLSLRFVNGTSPRSIGCRGIVILRCEAPRQFARAGSARYRSVLLRLVLMLLLLIA